MKEENRQLKFGALISYLAIFINTTTALIYLPWMARKIGQSNYALYNLAYSFLQIFLSDFGLSASAARFLAKYRAEHQEQKSSVLLSMITRLNAFIDLIFAAILIILYFFLDQIYKGLTPAELAAFRPLFLIMAGYSILSFPFQLLNGILQAYEKFIQLKLCDLGQKLLTVIMIVTALLNGGDVTAVMLANVISGVLFIMIKVIIVHRETVIRINLRLKDPELLKSIMSFTAWTAITLLAQRFIFSLAPSILGIVSDSTQIAIFSPANALEGYFYMFAAAVNGLFLARISRYIADRREDRIYSLMVTVGRYQLAFMGMIFIGFFCIGKEFMTVWMGPEYESSALCAFLVFIPDLLLFTEEIADETLIAKNLVKQRAFANIGMTLLCTGLSFPLSSFFGAAGACMAIAISYLFTFICMNIVYSRELHLDIPKFFRECYGSFLIPYLLIILISSLILPHVPFGGWKGLILKGLIVAMIYLILIWNLALKKEEKQMVRKIFFRRSK